MSRMRIVPLLAVVALLGVACGAAETAGAPETASEARMSRPVPEPVSSEVSAAAYCDGTPGQWAGCRGNGCAVCAELVANYPKYFVNHPSCSRNTTCAGESFACNSACPAPTAADMGSYSCSGSCGKWTGYCFCDPWCLQAGDCCSDYQQVCGG
ncbi:MAG TPA: hypothetical protein VEU33_49580 [Archangium sp.]|nr:hypothetical protein [Archangium sp.]